MEKLSKRTKGAAVVLGMLVILSLGSQYLLLDRYFEVKRKVSECAHLSTLLEGVNHDRLRHENERKIEGSEIPNTLYHIKQDNAREPLGPAYTAFFYFSINSCNSCLRDEIPIWNEVAEKFNNGRLEIIGITDGSVYDSYNVKVERFIQSLNIRFKVQFIDSLRHDMLQSGIKADPAILLIDNRIGKILYSFFPTPSARSSDGFVQRIERLLARR